MSRPTTECQQVTDLSDICHNYTLNQQTCQCFMSFQCWLSHVVKEQLAIKMLLSICQIHREEEEVLTIGDIKEAAVMHAVTTTSKKNLKVSLVSYLLFFF